MKNDAAANLLCGFNVYLLSGAMSLAALQNVEIPSRLYLVLTRFVEAG
ncbi:MAG: hypothetical protein GXP16_18460 [Gammaproteobacteria bacterium]|nr:hypothetical protein [Gammaproteobacteria bacterium]